MILRKEVWEKIREHFSDDEKATLRSAVSGETVCPAGVVLDAEKLDAGLANKLETLAGGRV